MPPPSWSWSWAGDHLPPGAPSADAQDYVFFLSKDVLPYGCFSNAFREANGHRGLRPPAGGSGSDADGDAPRFWCVNQELHYRKAVLFGDDATARLILAERDDAAEIKRLGRTVRGYDDAAWRCARYGVCRDAVLAKFSQDAELRRLLVGTRTRIIVEAAADATWGIGLVEFSGDGMVGAKDVNTGRWDVQPRDWRGENLLGRCLMDVRRMLSEGSE